MDKAYSITWSSSLGWTTIYINILCLLIYITWSSSLGWTTIYINILCFLIYITWSSSNRLDDGLYQYTLSFNIYYFVVQPRLDDRSK